ncbi:fimbrial protein [Burkholderia vietnamiensis]|uniref:fimbrial protein n=1 Tax=Burkholderia vietnamiensis TaxID=60552 RepID=UPI001B95CCE6|nr:fimbrial protein [Burkholderia vietnamiensis]MBR8202682.1 fimbrial protein [Burkholderia vietnamiensis]MCA8390155.1 fimbrial protein [Burkholderia vietnamiensis]HDR8958964.1 fimbrial protein [Burkholderia vietnamiensis]HDR9244368.1 fimbrial protein [Burkholderia vietnamiensis]
MKKILAAAALAAVSASTFAAATPGTIRFQGEIVAGACGISQETLDQTVSLGQVPSHVFKKVGDRSEAKNFNIVLTDCDTSTQTNAFFTFTGASDATNADLIATAGSASNVGIRLQAGANDYLKNGTEQSSPVVLSKSGNTVTFGAMYEATAAAVTPGIANAVANFTVRYQ